MRFWPPASQVHLHRTGDANVILSKHFSRTVMAVLGSILLIIPMIGHAVEAKPALPAAHIDTYSGKPRVAIISDIGGDPDDQMSLVRLLLYSNELDIEAMIAATSTHHKTSLHPEVMHKVIDAYGQVRQNLLLHDTGWPKTEDLDRRVLSGQSGYGLASIGEGKSSAGSRALVEAIERDDQRPLWICVWAGANTLAQALIDLRSTKDQETMHRLIARLRVYSIVDQDDAGPWIRREFPELFYVVTPSRPEAENSYLATCSGISGDSYMRINEGADSSLVTNEWLDKNLRSKGPLGKVYPRFLYIMEGDTPSFLGLIDNGLNAYRRPDWGGWGGRYVYVQPYGETRPIWSQGEDAFFRTGSPDAVTGIDGRMHVSDQATIWRWREAFQNDFAARMDWTIEDFAHANHNPLVVVNGKAGTAPVEMEIDAGQTITLDATGTTDPDGQALGYKWFVYPEAGLVGTRGADVTISGDDQTMARVTARSTCRPMGLLPPGSVVSCSSAGVVHIILAVTDDGSPHLTSYRRIILKVNPASQGSHVK